MQHKILIILFVRYITDFHYIYRGMLLVFYSFYFSDMGFLQIIIDCVYNITHPLSLRIMGDHALDQDVAVNVSVIIKLDKTKL